MARASAILRLARALEAKGTRKVSESANTACFTCALHCVLHSYTLFDKPYLQGRPDGQKDTM